VGCLHLRADIIGLKHGGNVEEIKRNISLEEGVKWFDLSSAVNKEPWSVPVVDTQMWAELPDLYDLTQAAAQYYGRDNSMALSGTQQAIEWLPVLLPQISQYLSAQNSINVMLPSIGYQEHADAWKKWGYKVLYYSTLEELLSSSWDIAVVINPNNPTTDLTTSVERDALVKLSDEKHKFVILDEAFIDPTAHHSVLTCAFDLGWPEGLIVLRSVGKFFGLAGARVGFCFASKSILSAMQQVIGPWPISTVSAYLTTCALQDITWQKQAIDSLKRRRYLFEEMIQPLLSKWFVLLGGQGEWRSSTLFFSVFLERHVAEKAFELLQKKGIHIRLGEGWLRFALPASTEFTQLEKRVLAIVESSLIDNTKVL